MKAIKTLLLASAFVAGGALVAAAQTGTSPGSTGAGAGAAGEISAATHCKDSSGNIQLKSAMSGSDAAGSTTGSGSASGGTTPGSGSGMSGSTSGPGSTGSGMGASGSSAAATNLPAC